MYNEILLECKELHKRIKCSTKKETDPKHDGVAGPTCIAGDYNVSVGKSTHKLITQSSQSFENNAETTSKWPAISINIIDSDNIYVCMCSQISNDKNEGSDSVDGSICPECQNIIKKQPVEPRYRLISKRLMLSNNIIVNRIDTQHLSTYFDISQKRQDPYTPESAESHSPYPELSSSTTTSSNSHTTAMDNMQLLNTDSFNIAERQTCTMLPLSSHSFAKGNPNVADATCGDGIRKQHRGIVSPVQLKSRLEDLQKKSSIQNIKFHKKIDGDTAGDSDVEDVDEICQSTNVAAQRYSNSCLPKCCNIH